MKNGELDNRVDYMNQIVHYEPEWSQAEKCLGEDI